MPLRTLLLFAALNALLLPTHAQTCSAATGPHATPVVELYTSEGCSSCPPADRWLSAHKADGVVALAFHVDYWDGLGWVDRFASPAYTQRQMQQQAVNGSRYSYTPQVVINGVDRKDWSALSRTLPSPAGSGVQIGLARSGERITATVVSTAPARLAAYWAVTESGLVSAVKSGENAGATLTHDHVVRELVPVPTWAAEAGVPATLQLRNATQANPRRAVNLVVVNASTGRPVQALKLGC